MARGAMVRAHKRASASAEPRLRHAGCLGAKRRCPCSAGRNEVEDPRGGIRGGWQASTWIPWEYVGRSTTVPPSGSVSRTASRGERNGVGAGLRQRPSCRAARRSLCAGTHTVASGARSEPVSGGARDRSGIAKRFSGEPGPEEARCDAGGSPFIRSRSAAGGPPRRQSGRPGSRPRCGS